jgi:hypothetical protein
MMPPRIASPRLAVPIGIVFAGAVLLGWNAGDVAVPPPAPLPPIRWSLPRPRVAETAKDFAVVTAGRPWNRHSPLASGTRPGQGRPGAAAPSWRLAGIVERGGAGFALIASGAGATAKLDYLRIGDRLPDGSVLLALGRDSATAAAGKSRPRIYRLFGKKP